MNTTQKRRLQADSLQEKGLLRRAFALWAEIEKLGDEEVQAQARHKQSEIAALLKQRRLEQESAKYNCRHNIAADRQAIVEYLRNGMTPREIVALTQRSSAFIYSCRKWLSPR